jgi:hypothetical protein
VAKKASTTPNTANSIAQIILPFVRWLEGISEGF